MDTPSHVPQDYGHPENDLAERSNAPVPEVAQQGALPLEPDVSEQRLTSADGSDVPTTNE